jgi:hypothetical protein
VLPGTGHRRFGRTRAAGLGIEHGTVRRAVRVAGASAAVAVSDHRGSIAPPTGAAAYASSATQRTDQSSPARAPRTAPAGPGHALRMMSPVAVRTAGTAAGGSGGVSVLSASPPVRRRTTPAAGASTGTTSSVPVMSRAGVALPGAPVVGLPAGAVVRRSPAGHTSGTGAPAGLAGFGGLAASAGFGAPPPPLPASGAHPPQLPSSWAVLPPRTAVRRSPVEQGPPVPSSATADALATRVVGGGASSARPPAHSGPVVFTGPAGTPQTVRRFAPRQEPPMSIDGSTADPFDDEPAATSALLTGIDFRDAVLRIVDQRLEEETERRAWRRGTEVF